MEAVRPQSRVTVIKEFARKRLNQRTSRKVSAVAAADVIADVSKQSSEDSVDAAGFCGESFADNGELLSSLSPLLFSMKLFGLYFERQDRNRRRTDDPESNHPATTTARTSSTCLRIFATVHLIVAWLNAIRFLLVFNRNDKFGAALMLKIAVCTWFWLAAIFQTAYYYASHTGQLLKVLHKLPVTRECVRNARRAAVVLAAFVWFSLFVEVAIGSYFYFDGDRYDFVLTPFVTHIDVQKGNMTTARVLGYIVYLSAFPGVFFSHSMNEVLIYIFCSQFRKLKINFRRALDERGEFTEDLSLFRRRQQLTDLSNVVVNSAE